MSDRVLNQPWEDIAEDVTGAIEKAVQPLLKKAVDDIYAGLLDTTQDYLTENLAFNIASRIDCAEREAATARARIAQLEAERAELVEKARAALQDFDAIISESGGVYGLHLNGDPAPWGDLTSGGRYEEWTQGFEALRATLSRIGKTDGVQHDGMPA